MAADFDEEFSERARALELANRRHRTKRHRLLLAKWLFSTWRRPRRLPRDPAPNPLPSQVALTFGGHATTAIQFAGLRVLMDPIVGERLGHFGLIRRHHAAGIDTRDVRDADVILISSTDPAHFHLPTLKAASRRSTVILPRGGAAFLRKYRFNAVIELAANQTITSGGVSITTTVAHTDDQPGLCFVLRGDGPTLFIAGRTGYGPVFREVGQDHGPDLAILPIGGYCPSSFRRRHLSPLDALYAFEDLKARLMMPIRFGTFALSYERLDEPSRWLGELVETRNLEDYVVELAPGESRLFTNPRRARRPTPYAPDGRPEILLGSRNQG